VTDASRALLIDIPERLETANLTLAATRAGMGAVVHDGSGFTLEGVQRNARRDNAGELAGKCMYAITS
jgi:hypothetical protein